jgi:hypothetical protein
MEMRALRRTALILALPALGTGCGGSRREADRPGEQELKTRTFAAPPAEAAVAPAGPADAPQGEGLAPDASLALEAVARKLIRTGHLTIEVADFAAAAKRAEAIAKGEGGYVADTNASRGDAGQERGTLTLRVPAERFDVALAALRALGTVRSESVETQDVTKAYADVETRLRVKRETLARLRDILGTRTGKLSDVLDAEREIARVTEEIERLEGERRYYDQQTALSTVAVELYEPEAALRPSILDPIRDAVRRSAELLAQSVAALLVVVFVAVPWVAALLFLVWVVRRVRGRRSRA